MTNLDSIFKSRDITLPTKVHLVKAMVFPVVMYGCESWTVKKAERQRIDVFELWCWRRWRRQWHPTPVLLPGKSRGWRSLVAYSLWGRKESDMTEQLHFSFSCIGEGNGIPLQCSCLENPMEKSLVGCRLWGCTESDTTKTT